MTDEPPEDATPDEERVDAPVDEEPTAGGPSDDERATESATDLADDERASWRPTRRRLLQGAAASTALAGVGSIAFAQDDEPLNPAETIVLGGQTQAWQGRDPARIDGESNPTLNLQVGETYDLTWINVDGLPHNIAFLDSEGETIRATEIIDEQGAEQSVSIAVTERFSEYLCEVHPTSMRGDIETTTAEAEATPGTPGDETPAGPTQLVPEGPTVGLQQIAGEPLTQPVAMATEPGGNRRFVVDQTGELWVIRQDGGIRQEPFLDISDRLAIDPQQRGGFDERGFLGVAFHPNFQENGRFFVRYSSPPRNEELPEDFDHMFLLSEFQATEDRQNADPESETILMEIPEPQFNHNAGDISFGPDDYLYVTVGDGGGADDTGVGHVNDWYRENGGGNGQDVTENLLGSILRIDVDGQETIRGEQRDYAVPDDNPLVGTEGLSEHWAWGFRNPWRMSFNRGELIAADVGQNLFEEVDHVVKGGNYGWNVREGFHCFSTEMPNSPQAITECPTNAPEVEPYNGQNLIDPLLEYPHAVSGTTIGLSVTGGFVYFNDTVQGLNNQYVFGDWSANAAQPRGRLWVADLPIEFDQQQGTQTGAGTEAGTETAAEGTPGATPGEPTPTGTGTPSDGTPAEGTPMETPADETPADGTPADGTGTPTGENVPQFPMRELVVEGAEGGRLNRTVLAFGRDQDGELYVLTSSTTTVDGTGHVFKIVPPEEGDQITPPPTPTPSGTETGTPAGTVAGTAAETEAGTETDASAGTEAETPAEETATETDGA